MNYRFCSVLALLVAFAFFCGAVPYAYAQVLTAPEESVPLQQDQPQAEQQKTPSGATISEQSARQSRGKPIEITADKTLEWHSNDNKFIAIGNARAVQDQSAIDAQTLTALYRKTPQSDMDIYELQADKDVTITSGGSKASGQRGVYDIPSGIATLTGGALKLTAPDGTVTARDRFEYNVHKGVMHAYGNATLTRMDKSMRAQNLRADRLKAVLIDDARGERSLKTLEAFDNVIIQTATEIITGDRAIYRAGTKDATITGNVTIKRGQNILEGERADVDLNTNVSRLFGSDSLTGAGDGRVRGVFYPKSQN